MASAVAFGISALIIGLVVGTSFGVSLIQSHTITQTTTGTNVVLTTVTQVATVTTPVVVLIQPSSQASGSQGQTTMTVQSSSLCPSSQSLRGECVFGGTGLLNINGSGAYYYFDASLAGSNPFTFRNVTFTFVPDMETHAGPTVSCPAYFAKLSNSSLYELRVCQTYPGDGEPEENVVLAPQNSPQVGLMSLPDNSLYVLVRATG